MCYKSVKRLFENAINKPCHKNDTVYAQNVLILLFSLPDTCNFVSYCNQVANTYKYKK